MIPLHEHQSITKNTNEQDNINLTMKPDNSKITIEEIIEAVFEKFSQGLRIIGPIFAFALTVFVGIVAHSFFSINVPYFKKRFNVLLGMLLGLKAAFLLFSILFNYFLAVLVKPGSLEDIRKSKYHKKRNPYEADYNIIDLKKILTNKSNTELNKKKKNEFKLAYNEKKTSINELETIKEEPVLPNSSDSIDNKLSEIEVNLTNETDSQDNTEFDELDKYYYNKGEERNNTNRREEQRLNNCKFCKEPKPIRAHHCSICNTCVLKMDHHCPWINNCIGHNNHRYFVLFLTHTMLGCFLVATTSIPLIFDDSFKKTTEFNFVTTLSLIGFLILVFFNAWNWFLVFKGNTTIEYWSIKSGLHAENNILDFSMPDKYDNLLLIFGTRSLWKAILIPSIKKLPISGLEWTRIVLPEFHFVNLNHVYDLNITVDESSKNV